LFNVILTFIKMIIMSIYVKKKKNINFLPQVKKVT